MVDAQTGFRQTEIQFLQDQNKSVIEALERVEKEREEALRIVKDFEVKEASLTAEFERLQVKIGAVSENLQQQRAETHSKEEHIRVLGDQNKQLLDLLESTEDKVRLKQESNAGLTGDNEKLALIEQSFDEVKSAAEKEVAAAKRGLVVLVEAVRTQRDKNDELRTDAANFEAQTSVDLEALEQALSVVKAKNVDYIQQIQQQEVKSQQFESSISTLNEDAKQIETDLAVLKAQMEEEDDEKAKFTRNAGEQQTRLEGMEAQVDALKKALATAERSNESLQEENRQSADKFREMADKVYALMDSLRLNQVELKKHEAENSTKERKCQGIEKQVSNLESKIEIEVEARQVADTEKREAEQQSALLKKANKKLEEQIGTSQQRQEECERKTADVAQQVSALQTQNAYLASRVDGMEDEKNEYRAELKKGGDKLSELVRANAALHASVSDLTQHVSMNKAERDSLRAQLEYIKREDVLDESGRQRPILIQSNQSTLLERLQINEFLYEAQQSRTPIPLIIEKIAQMLELLHTAQTQADTYLADVSKSNALVSALRSKNMKLFEHVQALEQFKTRSVIRYVANQFEAGSTSMLYLDGLSVSDIELQEIHNLMQQYEVLDKIHGLVLADNALVDATVNMVLQVIFSVPYLKRIDLRKNCFTPEGIRRFQTNVQKMEGVTAVIWTKEQSLTVHSGNQLRLTIELADQSSAAQKPDATDFLATEMMSLEPSDSLMSKGGPTKGSVGSAGPGGPVGLGGAGDLAALGKGESLPALRKGGRQPGQKGKPGGRGLARKQPSLMVEKHPNNKVVDKWQVGSFPTQQIAVPQEKTRRPGSAGGKDTRNSGTMRTSPSAPTLRR